LQFSGTARNDFLLAASGHNERERDDDNQ